MIGGELLPHHDAAVEVDDLRHVVRTQPPHEIRRRGLQRRQVISMLALLSRSNDRATDCRWRVKT